MSLLAQTYRLTEESVAAAKESAYQRRTSLNTWAQEAVDFYLAHLEQMPPQPPIEEP